ncbi:C2 domain protein [Trichuris suis]|nr:C2 domain protein [Trichuris suis]
MFCNCYCVPFRQLVDRLDRMKRNTSGNRSNQCMLCGAGFGVMGPISCAAFCHDCHRYVCQKNCGLETADGKGKTIFLCKLCSETREIWKKSGAWFYRGIPEHVKVPVRPRSAEAAGSPTERRRLDGSMVRSMALSSSKGSSLSDQSAFPMGHRRSGGRRMLPTPPTETGDIRWAKPRWATVRDNASLRDKRRSSSSEEEEDEAPSAKSSPVSSGDKQGPQSSTSLSSLEQNVSAEQAAHLVSRTISPADDATGPLCRKVSIQSKPESSCDTFDGTETLDSKSTCSDAIRSESLSQSCSYSSAQLAEVGESFDSSRPRPVSLIDSRPVAQQSPSLPARASGNLSDALSRTSLNENALPWQSSEKVSPRQDSSYESSPDNDIGQRPPAPNALDRDLHEETVASELSRNGLNNCTASFGSLEFSLLYDEVEQVLLISIFKAANLPAMDSNGFSDPYVKLHLLPLATKATKLRTRTMPKTLNPCWNEQLIYHGVSLDDMKRKTLRLMVLDEDRIGSDFLGETRVPLKRVTPGKEKYFNVYLEKQMPVEKYDELNEERGKILLSLCYNMKAAELNVEVIRCVELLGLDASGYSDPYVKLLLKSETNKIRQAKTEVKKRTLNPVYNQLFRFNLSYEEMAGVSLCVQVWDKDVGKHDDFIGSLELGTSARGECMKHWIECIQNPNKIVKRWHRLTV